MRNEFSKQNEIFIATHEGDAYGPQWVLQEYLKEQKRPFAYAACPFEYAKRRRAQVCLHTSRQEIQILEGHYNTAPGIWGWLRDAWFIGYWGWKLSNKNTIFIGINNLNAVIGILLRVFGKCRLVIYYVIDYTPRRFSSRIINWIYQRCARFAARHSDMIWNLSERMREVHARFGANPQTSIMVPIGIHAHEYEVVDETQIIRNQWIIVSTLFESKGVQIIIDALKYIPQAQLIIVGTGPYEAALKARARDQGVEDRITFLGMAERRILFDKLAHSRVAFAPYLPDPANYSYYADPAKLKEYLACGIPVVITRVPWIAEEIKNRPMGLAVEYDARQIALAAKQLMENDEFWRCCRQEALAFSQGLDWQDIFKVAFAALNSRFSKEK